MLLIWLRSFRLEDALAWRYCLYDSPWADPLHTLFSQAGSIREWMKSIAAVHAELEHEDLCLIFEGFPLCFA